MFLCCSKVHIQNKNYLLELCVCLKNSKLSFHTFDFSTIMNVLYMGTVLSWASCRPAKISLRTQKHMLRVCARLWTNLLEVDYPVYFQDLMYIKK